jgi:hypothetical protein
MVFGFLDVVPEWVKSKLFWLALIGGIASLSLYSEVDLLTPIYDALYFVTGVRLTSVTLFFLSIMIIFIFRFLPILFSWFYKN